MLASVQFQLLLLPPSLPPLPQGWEEFHSSLLFQEDHKINNYVNLGTLESVDSTAP